MEQKEEVKEQEKKEEIKEEVKEEEKKEEIKEEENIDPKDLIQNSLISMIEGNYHIAIKQLTKVIEKDDKNYTAIFYRAISHLNRGGYDLSMKDFIEAEKLRNPEEEDEFYYLKGKANFYLENLEEAKNDLTKALTLKGLNEEAKNKINKLLNKIKES